MVLNLFAPTLDVVLAPKSVFSFMNFSAKISVQNILRSLLYKPPCFFSTNNFEFLVGGGQSIASIQSQKKFLWVLRRAETRLFAQEHVKMISSFVPVRDITLHFNS